MVIPRLLRPAAVLAVSLVVAASAQAIGNPPIRMAQGVEYMCGGRTIDEAAFMQTVAPRWAAMLQFQVNQGRPGALPAVVEVSVRERYTGRPVMEAATASPTMLARLDQGAYEITATLAGVSLRQPLVVFNGQSSSAAFVWPSNVDFVAASRGGRPSEQQAAMRLP